MAGNKKIILYGQGKNMCGPASLRMILSYYNIHVSEATVADLGKVDKNEGAWSADLVDAAKALGLTSIVIDNCTEKVLAEAIKDGPVIVNWTDGEGHYSVATNIDSEYIHLLDPAGGGQRRKIKFKLFDSQWYDSEPHVPMLTTRRVIIVRDTLVGTLSELLTAVVAGQSKIADVHGERVKLVSKTK